MMYNKANRETLAGDILCRLAILFMLMGHASGIMAQDRIEIGVTGGTSFYLGDMNPSQLFKNMLPSAGFIGRYMVSDRIAVKGIATYNRIKGEYTDANPDNYSYFHDAGSVLEEGQTEILRPQPIAFKNDLVDISIMGEINFLSFDHMFKKDQTRFTPYIALGVGCTSYRHYDDESVKKRRFVLSLPFGVGVKYKLNKLMRIGLEWTFHKTFTDELECVEDHSLSFDPADPYRNGVKALTHNNDWFSNLNVTLTVSLWPRKLECNDGLRSFYRD